MSDSNELVLIDKSNALKIFKSSDLIEEIINKVENEVNSFLPDISTAKGRKDIISLAYRVAQTKTYLDGVGKDLVAEYKEIPKIIDANRRIVREKLDILRDKARHPYTEWEAEQERAKAEQQMIAWHSEALLLNDEFDKSIAERFESDHEIALLLNEKFDRDIAEEKQAAEQRRIAYERELQEKAYEKAKQEAEAEIHFERLAAEKRERDLQEKAEQAENERIAAEKRARKDAEEERIKAEKEKQEAIAEERRKADLAEAERKAKEKRIADEAYSRAKNEALRKKIGREIVNALMEHTSISRESAIAVLVALKDNKIPHATIIY